MALNTSTPRISHPRSTRAIFWRTRLIRVVIVLILLLASTAH